MFCDNCGKKLIRGTIFCDNCGSSVDKGSSAVTKEGSTFLNKSLPLFIIKIPRLTKKFLLSVVMGGVSILLLWGINAAYDSYQEKTTSTQVQLQVAQKQLEDITAEIKQGQMVQGKQISEAKDEISFLKSNNEELRSSLNKQLASNIVTAPSTSSLVSTNGKYVVKVVCIDSQDNVVQGSGVIISKTSNNTTIIITNQHVIPSSYTSNLTYPCIVAYSSSPTNNFTNFYYANPVYWADRASQDTMNTYDFSYLEIKQEINTNGDTVVPIYGTSLILADGQRPSICKISDLQVGKNLAILGYASVGGNYLSVKDGIVSGFDGAYITTSAKIEQGDSGGGGFLTDADCFIGMPTYSISGKIESLGRVLALSYISSHLISIPELGN